MPATSRGLVVEEPLFVEEVWSAWLERNVRVLRVGKSTANGFKTLAEAIAHSRHEDRIELEGGEYFEAVTVHHCLEITSADTGDDPLISGRGPVVTIATDAPVFLSKIHVHAKGSKPHESVAVLIVKGSPKLSRCTISSLHVVNGAAPTVTSCVITRSAHGSGLKISDRASGSYTECEISHHCGDNVDISTAGSPIIRACRILHSRYDRTLISIAGGKHGSDCTPILVDNVISGTGELPDDPIDTSTFEGGQVLLRHDFTLVQALLAITWGAAPVVCNNTFIRGGVGIHVAEALLREDCFRGNRILMCASWGLYVGTRAQVRCHENDFIRNAGGALLDVVDNVEVSNCKFAANFHYGLAVRRAQPLVSKCDLSGSAVGLLVTDGCRRATFTANAVHRCNEFGILLWRGVNSEFHQNTVHENHGVGIGISERCFASLKGNRITESGASNVVVRGGSIVTFRENYVASPAVHNVVVMGRSGGVFEHNELDDCGLYAHIALAENSMGSFSHNVVKKGSGAGFSIEDCASPSIVSTTMSSLKMAVFTTTGADPLFHNNHITTCGHGIVVMSDGIGTFTGNTIRLCTKSTIHVTSGGDPTVRNNILTTCSASAIHVADGGLGLFEKNKISACESYCVTVEGQSSNPTFVANLIVDSEHGGLKAASEAGGRVIRCHFTKLSGPAVHIETASIVELRDNHITDNREIGVLASDEGCGLLVNNSISSCAGGGIRLQTGCKTKFEANTVASNGHSGIAICEGAAATFFRDLVESNDGCGVAVNGDAHSTVCRGVMIRSNRGDGVFATTQSACRFEDTLIEANGEAGLALDRAGEIIFVGCTVRAHGVCVRVTRDGKSRLERCRITDGHNGLLRVDQRGCVELLECQLEETPACGVLVSGGGCVVGKQSTISRCDVGLRAANSCVQLAQCTISRCNTGAAFATAAISSPRPKLRVDLKKSTPSANVIGYEGDSADLSVLEEQNDRSTLADCHILDNLKCGVHFENGGSGAVRQGIISRCEIGALLESNCDALLVEVNVESNESDGIHVDGTPASTTLLARLHVALNAACGLRLSRVRHLNWKGGTIEENDIGLLAEEGAATIDGCVIRKNTTAGARLCSFDRTRLSECTLEANGNTNLIVTGKAHVVVKRSVISAGVDVGLLFCEAGGGTIEGCQITTNSVGVAVRDTASQSWLLLEHGEASMLYPQPATARVKHGPSASAPDGPCGVTLRDCSIERNVFGMESLAQIKTQIIACTFGNASRCGLVVGPRSVCEVSGTSFEGNGTGLQILPGAAGVCTECRFSKNTVGIAVCGECTTILALNRLIANTECGMTIRDSTSVVVQENVFSRNGHCGVQFEEGARSRIVANLFDSEKHGALALPFSNPDVAQNAFLRCSIAFLIDGSHASANLNVNIFENNYVAVQVQQGAGGVIEENLFRENECAGVHCETSGAPQVSKNLFQCHGNGVSSTVFAVKVVNGGAGEFSRNHLTQNHNGALIEGSTASTWSGNFITDNSGVGIIIQRNGGGIIRENVFCANMLGDIVCRHSAKTLLIVGNAFTPSKFAVSFDGKAFGCFRHNVISCFEKRSTIAGLVISDDAAPEVVENLITRGIECGITCRGNCEPVIERNITLGCNVGLACRGSTSATARGNFFTYNRTHALVIDVSAAPSITQCLMGGGNAGRAAVVCKGGGTVTTSLIAACATGLHIGEGSMVRVMRNRFRDARTGVHFAAGSAAEFTGNNITSNEVGLSIAPESQSVVTKNNVAANHRFGVVLHGTIAEDIVVENVIFGLGDDGAVQLNSGASPLNKKNTVRNNVNVAPPDMDRGAVPNSVPFHVPKEHVLLKYFKQFCVAADVTPAKAVCGRSQHQRLLEASIATRDGMQSTDAASTQTGKRRISTPQESATTDAEDSFNDRDGPWKVSSLDRGGDNAAHDGRASDENVALGDAGAPSDTPAFPVDDGGELAPASSRLESLDVVPEHVRGLTVEEVLKATSWRQLLPGAKPAPLPETISNSGFESGATVASDNQRKAALARNQKHFAAGIARMMRMPRAPKRPAGKGSPRASVIAGAEKGIAKDEHESEQLQRSRLWSIFDSSIDAQQRSGSKPRRDSKLAQGRRSRFSKGRGKRTSADSAAPRALLDHSEPADDGANVFSRTQEEDLHQCSVRESKRQIPGARSRHRRNPSQPAPSQLNKPRANVSTAQRRPAHRSTSSTALALVSEEHEKPSKSGLLETKGEDNRTTGPESLGCNYDQRMEHAAMRLAELKTREMELEARRQKLQQAVSVTPSSVDFAAAVVEQVTSPPQEHSSNHHSSLSPELASPQDQFESRRQMEAEPSVSGRSESRDCCETPLACAGLREPTPLMAVDSGCALEPQKPQFKKRCSYELPSTLTRRRPDDPDIEDVGMIAARPPSSPSSGGKGKAHVVDGTSPGVSAAFRQSPAQGSAHPLASNTPRTNATLPHRAQVVLGIHRRHSHERPQSSLSPIQVVAASPHARSHVQGTDGTRWLTENSENDDGHVHDRGLPLVGHNRRKTTTRRVGVPIGFTGPTPRPPPLYIGPPAEEVVSLHTATRRGPSFCMGRRTRPGAETTRIKTPQTARDGGPYPAALTLDIAAPAATTPFAGRCIPVALPNILKAAEQGIQPHQAIACLVRRYGVEMLIELDACSSLMTTSRAEIVSPPVGPMNITANPRDSIDWC